MCYVCGCPGGGGEEGVEGAGHHKQLSYSDCSGQCEGRLFCHGDGISTLESHTKNPTQGGIMQALYATPAWACYFYLI